MYQAALFALLGLPLANADVVYNALDGMYETSTWFFMDLHPPSLTHVFVLNRPPMS